MPSKGPFEIRRKKGGRKKYENSSSRKNMRENILITSPTLERG
jgi:hypothetical protein